MAADFSKFEMLLDAAMQALGAPNGEDESYRDSSFVRSKPATHSTPNRGDGRDLQAMDLSDLSMLPNHCSVPETSFEKVSSWLDSTIFEEAEETPLETQQGQFYPYLDMSREMRPQLVASPPAQAPTNNQSQHYDRSRELRLRSTAAIPTPKNHPNAHHNRSREMLSRGMSPPSPTPPTARLNHPNARHDRSRGMSPPPPVWSAESTPPPPARSNHNWSREMLSRSMNSTPPARSTDSTPINQHYDRSHELRLRSTAAIPTPPIHSRSREMLSSAPEGEDESYRDSSFVRSKPVMHSTPNRGDGRDLQAMGLSDLSMLPNHCSDTSFEKVSSWLDSTIFEEAEETPLETQQGQFYPYLDMSREMRPRLAASPPAQASKNNQSQHYDRSRELRLRSTVAIPTPKNHPYAHHNRSREMLSREMSLLPPTSPTARLNHPNARHDRSRGMSPPPPPARSNHNWSREMLSRSMNSTPPARSTDSTPLNHPHAYHDRSREMPTGVMNPPPPVRSNHQYLHHELSREMGSPYFVAPPPGFAQGHQLVDAHQPNEKRPRYEESWQKDGMPGKPWEHAEYAQPRKLSELTNTSLLYGAPGQQFGQKNDSSLNDTDKTEEPTLVTSWMSSPEDDQHSDITSTSGDVDGLNDYSIAEYFEKYRVQALGASDEEDDPSETNSDSNDSMSHRNEKCNQKRKFPAWMIRRQRKERGKSYQKSNGTIAAARSIKAPCKHLKCNAKYNDDIRAKLLKQFLKLKTSGQNQFIRSHISVVPAERHRVSNSRRTFTRYYELPALNGKQRVCKEMFKSTLDIKDRKIRQLVDKSILHDGICPDDLRAKNRNPHQLTEEERSDIKSHISSFPAWESHYGREKSSKKYLSSDLSRMLMYVMYKELCITENKRVVSYSTYYKIFKSLNLSFRKPRIDTCNTCDELNLRRRLADSEEDNAKIMSDIQKHQKQAEFIFDQKSRDIEESHSSQDVITISFDLQKALATPHLNCNQVYYSRQMYTYNFTIFASSSGGVNKAYCYLWDESKGRRGANEIGSCLIKFFNELPKTVKRVNCYSDRCFGQNCNIVICSTFSALVDLMRNEGRELTITHNFMQSGHSHMECDCIHSSIERAKKKTTAKIEIPRDWEVFISTIRRKRPFIVQSMEQSDLLNLKQLDEFFKKPPKDSRNSKIRFSKIMSFKYSTAQDNVHFKYDLRDEDWRQMKLRIDGRGPVVLPGPITMEPLPLPEAKLNDLRKLLKFITNKSYYEAFLKELKPKKKGRRPILETLDHFEADLDVFEDSEGEEEDPLAL